MEQTLQEIYDYYRNQSSLEGSELVIAMLTEFQEASGYLSEEAQNMAAEIAGVNRGYIAAIIKNMPHLHARPFQHEIQVCMSQRCLNKGADEVLKKFQQLLKIKPGQVTRDGTFLLKVQYCMHHCAHGPNVKMDGKIIPNLKSSDVPELIRKYRSRQR